MRLAANQEPYGSRLYYVHLVVIQTHLVGGLGEKIETFNATVKLIGRDEFFLWVTEKKRLSISRVEGYYA
ncbi:hypothetical protein [Microbulbifer epialgicus]|uniref:Uncharacterized protein n=1 Tax=Microbulbifer epialgicus TaxID=393907 RepID=A0ABV4P747_9GAMM